MRRSPARNDELVRDLQRALSQADFGLKGVPNMLVVILRDGSWRERTIRETGEVVTFERFTEFVTAPPLRGLGATVKQLERLCADDPEARDLLVEATAGKHGGDRKSDAIKADVMPHERQQHGTSADLDARDAQQQRPRGRPHKNGNNIPIYSRPEGTSAAKALRRLRSERPDLHARVLTGELSPHGAAVAAGFRRKTITVPVDVEPLAAALVRHLPEADLERLMTLLLAARRAAEAE